MRFPRFGLLLLVSSFLAASLAQAQAPVFFKDWNVSGLSQSTDVAVAPGDSLIFVSSEAGGIYKINVSLSDPIAGSIFVTLGDYESVAFDSMGVLWGALESSSSFIGFDGTGSPIDTITTPAPLGTGNGTSIQFGPSGTMYATINRGDVLWKLVHPDSAWTAIDTVSGAGLTHIGVDANEHVFVVGYFSDEVYKYDGINNTLMTTWGGTGTGNGEFANPNGVAIGPDGLVYVTQRSNAADIQVFLPDSTYLGRWGTGMFADSPFGIDVDSSNNVFVTECCSAGDDIDVRMYTSHSFSLCLVDPVSIDFGSLTHGTTLDTTFLVINTGGGTLSGSVSESCSGYSIVSGGGAYSLAASETLQVSIRFEPTVTGTFMCTVETGDALCSDVALTGIGLNAPPVFASVADTSISECENLSFAVSAIDPDTDPLIYEAFCLPGGATFDSLTQVFSWAPVISTAGVDSVCFTVSDGLVSDTLVVVITVIPLPDGPQIVSITDVGNDQGKQVDIQWLPSRFDRTGDGVVITGYAIYRRIDPLPMAEASAESERTAPLRALAYPPGSWQYVLTAPARLECDYHVIAPTLADSTDVSGLHCTTFFVSALTESVEVFFDGEPDCGYSLDNLSPAAPQNVMFSLPGVLSWDEALEADFSYYTVYGSGSATFDGSAVSLYTTAETVQNLRADWTEGGVPPYLHYHVTASDFAGNEGKATGTLNTVAVPEPGVMPTKYALTQSWPNPFQLSTRISFDLPNPEFVRLRVFDVRGRLIKTLVEGSMPAGAYSIPWVADNGVASGLYFYQLEAGPFTEIRKTMLTR